VKKLEIVKKAITTVVSIGTAKIVKGIIENNVPVETTTDKVTVTAASAAIGGALGELSSNYTDAKIDEIVELIHKIKNRKNENQPELKSV
jgi:hypothetical protein